jgi:hypothetical protein
MQFIIEYENELLNINKQISENEDYFILRVKFIIYALYNNHTLDHAETLSFAYINSLQTNVTYINELETEIEAIKLYI